MEKEMEEAGILAKKRWDSLAKPLDSLGLLEDMVVKLCRIRRDAVPFVLRKRGLLICCADHGVTAEGVTQTGKEVTRIVAENFAKGCSTANYMAEIGRADVYPIDCGMDTENYPTRELRPGAVIDRKIARGSGNILKEPAMTAEQCQCALETGKALAGEMKRKGYDIVATGEMGIGNTTPTSVLAALLLGLTGEEVTGKGAGLPPDGLVRKRQVIEGCLERIRGKYPELPDAFTLLQEAGGMEIACMVGIFLGGVQYRLPVIIDGAISAVAALAAFRMEDRVADFVLASHQSRESTGRLALRALGAEPILCGEMCLGEGTGAVALLPLLDMALEVYQKLGTFGEYRISAYERYEERTRKG